MDAGKEAKKMAKNQRAYALRGFDESRILQRRYFKDFQFDAGKNDAEILKSLTATDIPLETLERNQKTIKAVYERLRKYHELLNRHQLRLARFNQFKAKKKGIKLGDLRSVDGGAPMIEYVTAEWNVLDLKRVFEKSYYELEKRIQKSYRAEFAARLKRARLAAGLTQKQLGDIIQISPQGVSLYERAEREIPNHVIIRLLKELNINILEPT